MKKHKKLTTNSNHLTAAVLIQRYVIHQVTLLIVMLIASGSILAEEGLSQPLTPDVAMTIAIRDNPSLAQIRARYDAMREIPSQVGALPDPTINLNAMNFPTNSFDQGQEPMTQVQIGFSQMFPFPGKLGLKKEAAEFEAEALGHLVEEAIRQLRRNVSTKWWQLYYLDRATDTLSRNQGLLRQFITVARTKYETGKGLQQDVLLAQLELSKLLDQEIKLTAMRRTQAIALNVLMDQLPSITIALPANVSTQMPELIAEETLGALASNERAQLKQMQSKVESAQARLKLAKRGYYPDFMVGMNYGDRSGMNGPPRGGEREDFASLMIGIKVPLYAKRKQAKAVAQRHSEVEMSRHALRNEQGSVLAEVSRGVTDYQRAKQQFSLFETGIIPQAKQTVSSMLAGYQVNEVDFLNLVRSQITLFNYELQYWRALSEANQALARLEAAVGKESIYE